MTHLQKPLDILPEIATICQEAKQFYFAYLFLNSSEINHRLPAQSLHSHQCMHFLRHTVQQALPAERPPVPSLLRMLLQDKYEKHNGIRCIRLQQPRCGTIVPDRQRWKMVTSGIPGLPLPVFRQDQTGPLPEDSPPGTANGGHAAPAWETAELLRRPASVRTS